MAVLVRYIVVKPKNTFVQPEMLLMSSYKKLFNGSNNKMVNTTGLISYYLTLA